MAEKKKFTLTVVGLSYRVTPATMRDISLDVPLRCVLEREPDNSHDENAVKVVIDEAPHKNFHLGYLAREVAEVIALRMDTGTFPFDHIVLKSVSPETATGEIVLTKGKIPGNR